MIEKQTIVRLMTADDVDGVYKVEVDAFSVPWTKEAFENEVLLNQFAYYLVAEHEGEIVGYCGVWIIMDEAHITNIAVHQSKRGLGIGDALMRHVLELSLTYGALTMTLEVRTSNHLAQNLYRKYGFEAGGIRKNYYTDNQEDALVMWVNLKERYWQ